MLGKVIFNADDFGISLGVNDAITEAHRKGILNSVSLMVNQKYTSEAVEIAKTLPDLELGLHLNLTNEYPVSSPEKIPLLVGTDGKFKNGFVKLLLLSIFRCKALKKQVALEAEAQIRKALALGVELKHIDSHRHIHLIPAIFEEVLKLKEKYRIDRIRVMNECALLTIIHNKGLSWLVDGGLIKYCLLRFLTMINGYVSDTYFYTMLYTCKLSRNHFENVPVPVGYKAVEIMIHPSKPEIDRTHLEDIFDESVVSPWRAREFETLSDSSVLKNFHFDAPYPFPIALYLKLEKWWFSLPSQLRYLLVGGFNTVFAYAVYVFLAGLIGLPYLCALIVQYIITVNVSVLTMRYYVFESHGNFCREWLKGWTVYLGMFAFNGIFLTFLVELCRLGKLEAQAVYLLFSTVITYFLHKYFSFRRKIKEK